MSSPTTTSSRNSSQNSAEPLISRTGRTVTAGSFSGTLNQVSPRCLGTSQSVRARQIPSSAASAPEDHTLVRSEEHTSELQPLMRISDAGFRLLQSDAHK